METVSTSQRNLFWNRLGKWQISAVMVTLVTFFITLYLTGDKEIASNTSFFVITLFAAILPVVYFTAFFAAALFAGLFAATSDFYGFALIYVAIAFFAIAFFLAILAVDQAKKYGIRKRFVWLSYVLELIVVFLTMLLA